MVIFKIRSSPARLSQSLRDSHNNLYTPEQFGNRLALEKRKAERLHDKFSMIIFSLERYMKIYADLNGGCNSVINRIIKLICSAVRETDTVSFCKDKIVSILLPDTDNVGAQCACQRLMQKLMKLHDAGLGKNNLSFDDFEIEIISYPEKSPEISLKKDMEVIESETERRTGRYFASAQKIAKAVDFRRYYLIPLNICVSKVASLSAAPSLADAFFWDQQMIPDFSLLTRKALKRAMDIVGAIIGLVIFSPLMIVVAVFIKLTSSGPILFKQTRLGYKGRDFTFLKFRSMYRDCDDNVHQEYVKKLIHGKYDEVNNGTKDQPFYKIQNDPRITPLGAFLRRTSIDELPQLWNVLKGEMSLVGPRPAIHYEVKEYSNWHYRRILEVKPGITGLWQVSGRSRTTFDEMVRLDIQYARNWSIGLDIKILFKTIRVIFLADGT